MKGHSIEKNTGVQEFRSSVQSRTWKKLKFWRSYFSKIDGISMGDRTRDAENKSFLHEEPFPETSWDRFGSKLVVLPNCDRWFSCMSPKKISERAVNLDRKG
jgi:hypothetical protein